MNRTARRVLKARAAAIAPLWAATCTDFTEGRLQPMGAPEAVAERVSHLQLSNGPRRCQASPVRLPQKMFRRPQSLWWKSTRRSA
jgi:hypothetical protein